MQLPQSIAAFGHDDFQSIFKKEVEQMPHHDLPLQKGLSQTSVVATDKPFQVMVMGVEDNADTVTVRAGVFYSGEIGGCACSDDPTPDNTVPEYCDLQFAIDRATAETAVTLL